MAANHLFLHKSFIVYMREQPTTKPELNSYYLKKDYTRQFEVFPASVVVVSMSKKSVCFVTFDLTNNLIQQYKSPVWTFPWLYVFTYHPPVSILRKPTGPPAHVLATYLNYYFEKGLGFFFWRLMYPQLCLSGLVSRARNRTWARFQLHTSLRSQCIHTLLAFLSVFFSKMDCSCLWGLFKVLWRCQFGVSAATT